MSDLVHVACESGELVSLPAAGGDAQRVLKLGRDLRDVVVDGDRLLVSRFKTADVLVIDAAGQHTNDMKPSDSVVSRSATGFQPAVAWRMIPAPLGGVLMAHQRANPAPISIGPSGYYGGAGPCTGAIVEGAVTPMNPSTDPTAGGSNPPGSLPAFPNMIGPSDIAVSADGKQLAVISIGNAWGPANASSGGSRSPAPVPVVELPKLINVNIGQVTSINPCGSATDDGVTGEPIAVAFAISEMVIQSREPAQLQVLARNPDGTNRQIKTIRLSEDTRADTGVAIFHMNSGFGISCASCHPEGNEDGRIWQFAEIGPRRTQTVSGGVLSTAPFHWSGDMSDFTTLLHEVFESRMGGARPNKPQTAAFQHWMGGVSAPVAPLVDTESASRGKALFESVELGCASCHTGSHLTNNKTYDVGTRGQFQVPSLIGVSARAPFLHDGCAATLRDRFGACGGGDLHGSTSQLAPVELDDLVSYLQTL